MKKFAFVPLAALVLGACAEQSPTAFTDAAAFNKGVSAPGTVVGASFTIEGSGEAVWQNYANAPINVPSGHSNTSCDSQGRYTRTAGGSTNTSAPHNERCGEFVGGSEEVTVNLTGIVANFVQPNSGNINLNFTVCGYVEDEFGNWVNDCGAKAFVHYHHKSDVTEGSGVVRGTDEDGNFWLVFLGSVTHAGNAEMAARTLTGVTAAREDGTAQTTSAALSW